MRATMQGRGGLTMALRTALGAPVACLCGRSGLRATSAQVGALRPLDRAPVPRQTAPAQASHRFGCPCPLVDSYAVHVVHRHRPPCVGMALQNQRKFDFLKMLCLKKQKKKEPKEMAKKIKKNRLRLKWWVTVSYNNMEKWGRSHPVCLAMASVVLSVALSIVVSH